MLCGFCLSVGVFPILGLLMVAARTMSRKLTKAAAIKAETYIACAGVVREFHKTIFFFFSLAEPHTTFCSGRECNVWKLA